ncbi:MAG: sensor domain-containing diguanylate cyclase [Candidatus Thiodiazotropha sp. (ex Notomyrtea botanica)]|nr:sensor domain-containing diguanylate cyclase [Candidatus Thiodiazotropha sp. (ex Notomyrtea botanica)]
MNISYDFLNSILDSITHHIAVIDHRGLILYVNQSWIQFGKENDYADSPNWVGRNYLEACDISSAMGDHFGIEASEGIRNVINREREDFYYEYPCDSPTEKRWFLMRIVPFELEGKRFYVISHSNITERKQAENKILELSRADSLTGLSNRRYFDEYFINEWNRCTRAQVPLTLAIIDIDYFKLFNDSYGHYTGDDCLKSISSVLQSYTKRPSDLCARYGGDEFMIIYGNTSLDESLVLILKLMDAIRKLEIPNPNAPTGPSVTVSIGLATAYPEMETNEEDLIRAADRLLYTAKNEGRDSIKFDNIEW